MHGSRNANDAATTTPSTKDPTSDGRSKDMMDPLKRHVTYVTWVAPLRAPIEPSHSCSSQLLLSLIFVISFLFEFFFWGGVILRLIFVHFGIILGSLT